MKKILITIGAGVAALSLSACGAQEAAPAPTVTVTAAPTEVVVTEVQQPEVKVTLGERKDAHGFTTLPVTVKNKTNETVSVWVTVRAENDKASFGDAYLAVEGLKPGQRYTDDLYFEVQRLPRDATFTLVSVEPL